MSSSNPLDEPPFTHIPGVDLSAPISAQCEQIDQLNTLLLQEIDANFAKFHMIITSKILPDIKRYAIASEPMREASEFWRTFFEAASAVRVTTAGDTTTTDDPEPLDASQKYEEADETIRERDSYLSQAEADGSFMFDKGNHVSSTPVSGGGRRPNTSFDDSLESPFDRVERQLGGLQLDEESSDAPTPSLPSGYSLSGLQADLSDVSTGTVEPLETHQHDTSSLARRHRDSLDMEPDKTPRAARAGGSNRRPLQPDPSKANWDGLTDLRTTPLNAFKFKSTSKGKGRAPKPSLANTIAELTAMEALDNESLPMSPPVTMTWNLPPRAQAVFNAGMTPRKKSTGTSGTGAGAGAKEDEGARRILDDLMEEMERGYEPSPRMPTPEGLRRYSIAPAGFGGPGPATKLFDPAASNAGASKPAGDRRQSRASRNSRRSMANTSFGSDILDEDADQPTPIPEDDSLEMEDDSIDSVFGATNTFNPNPTGAGAGQPMVDLLCDESFASSVGDTVHMGQGYGDDGMTQSSEAGMIFGGRRSDVPTGPAEEGGRGGKGKPRGVFSLHKQDEMSTFHGGKLLDAAGREVKNSPLAAGRGDKGQDLFTTRNSGGGR